MSEATPVNHEGDQGGPQLEALVDSALKLFHSKHTTTYLGNYFGYIASEASREALSQSGFSPKDLYSALTGQTSITPEDIDFEEVNGHKTWDEVETTLSARIVELELLKAHPELKAQNSERLNWESRSYKASRILQEQNPRSPVNLCPDGD